MCLPASDLLSLESTYPSTNNFMVKYELKFRLGFITCYFLALCKLFRLNFTIDLIYDIIILLYHPHSGSRSQNIPHENIIISIYTGTMNFLRVKRLHRFTKIMTSLFFTHPQTRNEFMLMVKEITLCYELLCKLIFIGQKHTLWDFDSTNTVESR